MGSPHTRGGQWNCRCHFARSPPPCILTGARGAQTQSAYSRDPEGTAGRATAGLDLGNLDHIVQELFSAGLVPATRQNYKTGTKLYLEFCNTHQVRNPFHSGTNSGSVCGMAPCPATGKWDGKELPSGTLPLPDCTGLGGSEDWEHGPARVCPQVGSEWGVDFTKPRLP